MNMAFNEAELAVVHEAAARENMAPAAWAARMVLAVAVQEVTPAPLGTKEVLQELVQSRAELRRIGNNWNQIARVLNVDGEVSDEQFVAVLRRVDEAVRRVDEATLQVVRERRAR